MAVWKPYKPVFIIYIDVLYAITIFFVGFMYLWSNIEKGTKTYRLFEFTNKDNSNKTDKKIGHQIYNVISYIILLTMKPILSVLFIKYFHAGISIYSREKFNRSGNTVGLFWFRLFYDVICF